MARIVWGGGVGRLAWIRMWNTVVAYLKQDYAFKRQQLKINDKPVWVADGDFDLIDEATADPKPDKPSRRSRFRRSENLAPADQ